MANQNYTVGIDVDLKGATSGLAQMEAAAKRTTAAVSSLKNELKNLTSVGGVGGQKDLLGSTGLGEQGAKRITEGTKAMREATSAMKSLQSVQQSMANTDFSAATQNMTNALKGMQQALAQITPMDQRRLEMLSQQLPLMRQAADLALRQSQAENQLAQAKLRVAQAEGQNIRNAGLANTTQADLARNLETSAYAAQRAASYYGIFSTALAALPALAVKNAASQERAFADVQRTTQESKASLEGLRVEYQRMSTEVPVAFEQLATIGTLGAQMDIAKEDLAEFTRAVSGFSSITGETVESTAMAFGRLQNMLGGELKESAVGAGDGYRILASQVAELGAKSVATEAEVLGIAQSIATTGHRAGLTQDQILGYSAALASVKIPAEWARGSFQRVFAGINTAVADGGDKLEAYGRQINLTGAEFEELWRSDPDKAFRQLLQSLQELDQVAQRQALSDLGIKNTRDVEFVSRLSASYDLLADSITNAEEASQNSDFLDNSVAIIADTFEGTIQRMQNALNNLLSNSGGAILEPLKQAANAVTALATAIDALPAGMKAFVGSALAVGAVRLGIQGLSLAAVGFLGNVAQTRRELGALGLTGSNSLRNVAQAYRIATGEAVKLQAATKGVSSANIAAGAAGAASGLGQMTKAAGAASGAMGLLKGGLSTVMGVFGGPWGLAITAGITAISVLGDAMTESSRQAEDFRNALETVGGTDSLWKAIKQDSLEAAEGTQTAVTELASIYDRAGSSTTANTDASKLWITTQGEVVTAAQAVESQLETNTLVMGKNTQEVLFNALKQTEAFKGTSTESAKALAEMGFNLTELTKIASGEGGSKAADEYINNYIKRLEERQQEIPKITRLQGRAASGDAVEDPEEYKRIQAQIDALNNLKGAYSEVSGEIEQAAAQAILMGQGFEEGADGIDEATDAMDATGEAAMASAENVKELTQAFHDTVDAAFAVTNATAGVYEALDNLATSVAENGSYFGPDSPGGRANLDALNSYLDAVVDLASAQAEDAGLTVEETTSYIAEQVQWALDDLASQGYDLSGVEGAVNNTEAILARNLQGPDVDDSRLNQRLVDMQNNSNAAANQVEANLARAEAALAKYGAIGRAISWAQQTAKGGGNKGSKKGSLGLGARAGAAVGSGIGKSRLPGIASALGGYRGAVLPSRSGGGGGGGGSTYTPRSSTPRTYTPRSSTPRSERPQRDTTSRAEKKVKSAQELFEDFLSRLSQAMNKAMESFWKTTSATDAYQKQLISMRKNIQATKDKIEELRKSNQSLATDILEAEVRLSDAKRFNAIALKYGDLARAQATQADIAKAQLEIDEKKAEISKNNKEVDSLQRGMYALRGYSEAAIENRAALKALQQTMVEMVEAYAAQGHSTQEVERYTQQLKREFIQQATQMGFNNNEVVSLAGAFDGLSRSIINTPREAEVEATDRGSVNYTQGQIDGIHGHDVQMPVYADTTPFYNAVNNAANYAAQRLDFSGTAKIGKFGLNRGIRKPGVAGFRINRGFARGGKVPGRATTPTSVDNLVAAGPNKNVFGLRSGEWVMNAKAVARYGDGFMKAVNERKFNPSPAVVAAPQAAGPAVVDLTPATIGAIGRAVSTQVSIGDRPVANAANAAVSSYNNRGGF